MRVVLAAVAAATLAVAIAAASCGPPRSPAGGETASPRVITLAPSLTEIAYAVGCARDLVADTSYDDYPPEARRLPHVADLVSVNLERVAALKPTIVVALRDQEREGSQIAARLSVRVVYLPNRNLSDLFADIAGVGGACRAQARARWVAARIRARIVGIEAAARRAPRHPRVLYLLGLPGFTAGRRSYINDLIEGAGGVNSAHNVDLPYPNLSAEQILALDPDVIIVSHSVPFGSDVRTRPPWRDLRAIRQGRVLRPPNDDIIERNGPRVVEGLAWLAKALQR